MGEPQIVDGAFSAFGLCLAEPAPFAAAEVALTLVCQPCLFGQFSVCPGEQSVLGHLEDADVGLPGLIDGHADGVNVVDAIEDFQGTQGVEHHLGIVVCADFNPGTVFQIHYVQQTFCDADTVAGAESSGDPTGEVHPLLDHDHRVGASLFGGFQKLYHIGCIPLGAIFHLSVVPGEIFDRVFRGNSQCLLEPGFSQRMSIGTFGGIVTAFVLVGFA